MAVYWLTYKNAGEKVVLIIFTLDSLDINVKYVLTRRLLPFPISVFQTFLKMLSL